MKNGRNTAGQYSIGNSGRPHGSRNKATIAIESLIEGQAEALTQAAVSKALEGDSVALRLCMDCIAPPPKDGRDILYANNQQRTGRSRSRWKRANSCE